MASPPAGFGPVARLAAAQNGIREIDGAIRRQDFDGRRRRQRAIASKAAFHAEPGAEPRGLY